jgi:hypothetical protein
MHTRFERAGTSHHITHNMLKSLSGGKSMRARRKRAGRDDEFPISALVAEII